MTERRWTRTEVLEVVDIGPDELEVLEREQIVQSEPDGTYTETQVYRLRVCRTLQRDLGVNTPGIEVALNLLERIHAERRQFREVLDWLRKL